MIRPVNFSFNAETAVNNAFQSQATDDIKAQQQALQEFEGFAALLRDNGVDVTVIDDTPDPYTPDSIFPNNWASFHGDGTVCLYPMYAQNRRLERKPEVLQQLSRRFHIQTTLDFTGYEQKGLFLEGTGSLVLDRDQKIAYACLSPRTDKTVLLDFCEKMGYTPESFTAVDGKGMPIYHTNVVMCVGDRYVVICLEAVPDPAERESLANTISRSGKTLIPISLSQLSQFAGNMLQVHNDKGEQLLVMSTRAYSSLEPAQITRLTAYNRILHAPLTTIEANGGGSARCMMAEIFLKQR